MITRLAWMLILLCPGLYAQEEAPQWWFDVEVIIFDRGQLLPEVAEQFEKNPDLNAPVSTLDLLTPSRQPSVDWIYQGLANCTPEKIEWVQPPFPPEWPELPEVPELTPPESDLDNMLAAEQAAIPEPEPEPVYPKAVEHWMYFYAPEIYDENLIDSLLQHNAKGCYTFEQAYDPALFAQPDVLPVVPFGASRDETWGPHLLSQDDFALTELSKRIRSERKLTRLLHTAWRQPVAFGRENAATVRVYGGQNFGITFNNDGMARLQQDHEVEQQISFDPLQDFNLALSGVMLSDQGSQGDSATAFERRLGTAQQAPELLIEEDSQVAEDIWQVDGTIKLFLQYINRVPYLHIDGDIAYRQPIPIIGSEPTEQQLVSIPYKQLRRVISTQLHYFDHPMFGMLVEIRRYKTP